MDQSHVSPTALVDEVLALQATQAQHDAAFFKLSPAQRAAAMWRAMGGRSEGSPPSEPVRITMGTLYRWAQRFPHEVPLINGEFAFIAVATPEIAEPRHAVAEQRHGHSARLARPSEKHSVAARLRARAAELRAIANAEAADATQERPR